MANYERNRKMEKTIKFVERMKKVQEEARIALKRAQEKMKRQEEVWKVEDKIMLSTKDFVFKEKPVKKLVDQYFGPYIIDKVVSTNTIKFQLPTSMRIHLVVNVS